MNVEALKKSNDLFEKAKLFMEQAIQLKISLLLEELPEGENRGRVGKSLMKAHNEAKFTTKYVVGLLNAAAHSGRMPNTEMFAQDIKLFDVNFRKSLLAVAKDLESLEMELEIEASTTKDQKKHFNPK